MKICPKCGGKRFIVPVNVVQDWVVDENGNYIDVSEDSAPTILHYPDNNDTWECEKCGYTSSGDGLEMKEYDVTISYTTSRTFTVKARNADEAIDRAVINLGICDSPISYAVFHEGNCVEDGTF